MLRIARQPTLRDLVSLDSKELTLIKLANFLKKNL